jgi:hypothetical protein
MSGAPLRPSRDSFGPTYRNSTAVRDPTRQAGADSYNLLCWQSAGMGLVAPRTMLIFRAQLGPLLLGRVEAWNPKQLTTGAYVNPTLTRSSVGNYIVEYPSPVPDELDVEQAIAFTYATGFCVNSDPTALKHVQAAPVSGNAKQIRVCIFSSGAALQDGNDVAVFGW